MMHIVLNELISLISLLCPTLLPFLLVCYCYQEKRKQAQEVQSKNLYPHTLSRGGYGLLREKILEEKEKQIQEASQSDFSLVVEPPSSPERHELWKRARQRRNGNYTSERAQVVAEKIVSNINCNFNSFLFVYAAADVGSN